MPSSSFANAPANDGVVYADGFVGPITGAVNGIPAGFVGGSATDAITAHSGGGQASATLLATGLNGVTTVAAGNDSVALPLAQAGLVVYVANQHATNSVQVFGSGTDLVDGIATGTGVALAATKNAVFFCLTSAPAGHWRMIKTA